MKSYEIILIWTSAEADAAVALRCRIYNFPPNQIARTGSSPIVDDSYRVGTSTWSLASVYDLIANRFAVHWSDQA